jgi:hypothetical protein
VIEHGLWIEWEIAPFYRRWQGWRRLLWWAWPVRWVVVDETRSMTRRDYCLTASEAASRMTKRALEYERDREDI